MITAGKARQGRAGDGRGRRPQRGTASTGSRRGRRAGRETPTVSGMTDIDLGTAYTWDDARSRGATRGQIAQDGVRIGRGLYLSSAVEPDLATR